MTNKNRKPKLYYIWSRLLNGPVRCLDTGKTIAYTPGELIAEYNQPDETGSTRLERVKGRAYLIYDYSEEIHIPASKARRGA